MTKFDSIQPERLLFLDVGNTAVKGAYIDDKNWKSVPADSINSISELNEWLKEHADQIEGMVVSSVRNGLSEAIQQKVTSVPVRVLSVSNIPAHLIDYETPETLGIDRFLVCYGAKSNTKNAVVVIDAGTATTIDYMSEQEVYSGGMITPGISSFMHVLPSKAPALPKTEISIPLNWPGKNTTDSLKWGQAGFYKMGLDQSLTKFEVSFGNFDLYLTGGDAPFIKKLINRECTSDPFLVFKGMMRLLGR